MTISVDVTCNLGSFMLRKAFEAPNGFTVLTGPSGSGKTTLLHVISGLLRPQTGFIAINGQTLFDSQKQICLPVHRRRIGYVFQDARLFPHLSVKHNLSYGRWFIRPDKRAPSLTEIAHLLGVEHLLQRKPDNLSGGEKQRVAIGRALLASPKLLLMDEPLSALDKERKDDIIPYLEHLHKQTGISIIYTTHNPEEVAHLITTHIQLD